MNKMKAIEQQAVLSCGAVCRCIALTFQTEDDTEDENLMVIQ